MEAMLEELSLLSELYDLERDSGILFENFVRSKHMYYVTGDYEFVTEGFDDFVDGAKNFFKKMIKMIQEWFKKFLRYFATWSMSLEKMVKNYKDDILAVTGVDFTVKGYNFSVMPKPKPDMGSFEKVVATYNSDLSNLDQIKSEEIKEQSTQFFQDSHLDSVRGEILGYNGSIKEEDFVEEVRRYYRGGETDPEDVHVTASMVSEIVNHTSKLIAAKKEAIEDRDKIIALLTKAESFFEKKVGSMYKGSDSYLVTKNAILDLDKKTFTTKDTETSYGTSDKRMKVLSELVTLKYNETKKLSGMINIVITERANAFKDQVKQETAIIRRVLTGRVKDSGEGKSTVTNVSDAYLPLVTNYIDLSEQVDLFTIGLENRERLRQMVAESLWYINALESGEILYPVTEGVLDNLVDRLKKLIKNIVDMFRKKSEESAKLYIPWVNDVESHLIERAEKGDLELLEFWTAKPDVDSKFIENAIDLSMKPDNSYKNVKNWANAFISVNTIEDLKSGSSSVRKSKLSNRFRIGEKGKDKDKIDPVSIRGDKLKDVVENSMIPYVKDYMSISRNMKSINDRIGRMKSPVSESTDPSDIYLTLLEAYVGDTDLALLEADGQPSTNPTSGTSVNSTTANASKTTETETTKNATKVVDKAKEDAKSNPTDTAKSTNGDAKKQYYDVSIKFLQDVITTYMSVCEERFVTYVRALITLSDADHKPVFENGEYQGTRMSLSDEKKREKEDVQDSTLPDIPLRSSYGKPTRGIDLFR